ncbi:hypothetical protein LPJ53_000638 [Coemansia erecta]|uniref:CBS domain-containing protein n=1 Tax=Coemansia erecta TaxID=147472 RepID=A0A9W8CVQ6_9FUNG|nr:hypothetical protein LPJ53_000638 [Coemansia erecta]
MAALEKYTVRDVLEYRGNPQLNRTIGDTNTVEEALQIMDVYDIVSLPVFGRSKSNAERSSFVDIVSVYDLRDYIIQSGGLEDEVQFQLLSGRPSGNPTALEHTIAQVVQSRKHASKEISASASLEQLLQLFTTHGQHRVLVTDLDLPTSHSNTTPLVPQKQDNKSSSSTSTGRPRGRSVDSGCSSSTVEYLDGSNVVVCGLTQYDVVRFIQHHNHEVGHALDASAMDIAMERMSGGAAARLPQIPHLSIRDSALHAMEKLRNTQVSALPVVDNDGRLITEVAGTGIRRLNSRNIGMLGKPVLAFMFNLHLSVTQPYVVHEGFTLSQIMSGLLRMNCRRAWLVDHESRPVAVISLTNVLQHFL